MNSVEKEMENRLVMGSQSTPDRNKCALVAGWKGSRALHFKYNPKSTLSRAAGGIFRVKGYCILPAS